MSGSTTDTEDEIPVAAPLRRPRPPADEPRVNGHGERRDRPPNQKVKQDFGGPRTNGPDRGQERRGQHNLSRPRQPHAASNTNNDDWESKQAGPSKPAQSPTKPEAAPAPKPAVAAPAPKPSAAIPPVPALRPKTPSAPPLVPARCLADLLDVGDEVAFSVEGTAEDCRAPAPGFVCVTLNEKYQADYQILLDDFTAACEADKEEFIPAPGDTYSYLNADDGGWYRARQLDPTSAALLDAGRVCRATAGRRLPLAARDIQEFSCLLVGGSVKVGDSLAGKVTARKDGRCTVALSDGATVTLTRWVPAVTRPPPPPAADTTQAAAASPANAAAGAPLAVERPPLQHGERVVLAAAAAGAAAGAAGAAREVLVRPAAAGKASDQLEQDLAQWAKRAQPLSAPPAPGQLVLVRAPGGGLSRALCRRTRRTENRYQLELLELGSLEVCGCEAMFECPPELSPAARPCVTSRVTLRDVTDALTPPALEYLEGLRRHEYECVLSLADGETTAPSGAAATLTLQRNNECVNQRVRQLSEPDWRRLERAGQDVLSTEVLMLSDLEYLPLPAGGSELSVLDASLLAGGSLSVCAPDAEPHAAYVVGPLSEQLNQYCNSEVGREPYLPREEELCVAQCPPCEQWYRAVLCQREGSELTLLYVDYGNLGRVDAARVRKALAEHVRGVPALACTVEIKDFPKHPTPAALAAARAHLQISAEGSGGVLRAAACRPLEPGTYAVDAPELLAAMEAAG